MKYPNNSTTDPMKALEDAVEHYRKLPRWDIFNPVDYHDVATAEEYAALSVALQKLKIYNFAVKDVLIPEFNTFCGAFQVAMLSLMPEFRRPPGTLIYHNVAPRAHVKVGSKKGERFLVALLWNGVLLFGPGSEMLQFVRHDIRFLYHVEMDEAHVQFRSRDLYPFCGLFDVMANNFPKFKHIYEGDDILAEIPEPPSGPHVAFCDNYGNVKTTVLNTSEFVAGLKPGQKMHVRLNEVEVERAHFAEGSFDREAGELLFSKGSTTFEHVRPDGSVYSERHMELFLHGDSASHVFKSPRPGEPIEISPID